MFYLFKMYLKARFVEYLTLLSTFEWANMLVLCKCMYIFVIVNQLTTQNNDKYCPKSLTGTAFGIKNMLKSYHGKLKPNRQQQQSVCQCADLTMTCPKLHVIIIKWAFYTVRSSLKKWSHYNEMTTMGTNIITHEYNWAHWIHKSLSFPVIPNLCNSKTV